MNVNIEETPPNLVARTGIEPVCDETHSSQILAPASIATSELFQLSAEDSKKSPQSSPIAARLSRQELRELIGICSREITYTGLSQDAGQRALALREKLQLIHAHGWQS